MYFEVSGRQTGKTDRLIKDLMFNILTLNNNEKYVIFSPQYGMSELIKNKISSALQNVQDEIRNKFERNVIYINSRNKLNEYIIALEMIVLSSQNVKIYIDEVFDASYINDVLFQWLKNDHINKNVYCCGTPKQNEADKDVFNKLKELNNGRVITMKWFSSEYETQEF